MFYDPRKNLTNRIYGRNPVAKNASPPPGGANVPKAHTPVAGPIPDPTIGIPVRWITRGLAVCAIMAVAFLLFPSAFAYGIRTTLDAIYRQKVQIAQDDGILNAAKQGMSAAQELFRAWLWFTGHAVWLVPVCLIAVSLLLDASAKTRFRQRVFADLRATVLLRFLALLCLCFPFVTSMLNYVACKRYECVPGLTTSASLLPPDDMWIWNRTCKAALLREHGMDHCDKERIASLFQRDSRGSESGRRQGPTTNAYSAGVHENTPTAQSFSEALLHSFTEAAHAWWMDLGSSFDFVSFPEVSHTTRSSNSNKEKSWTGDASTRSGNASHTYTGEHEPNTTKDPNLLFQRCTRTVHDFVRHKESELYASGTVEGYACWACIAAGLATVLLNVHVRRTRNVEWICLTWTLVLCAAWHALACTVLHVGGTESAESSVYKAVDHWLGVRPLLQAGWETLVTPLWGLGSGKPQGEDDKFLKDVASLMQSFPTFLHKNVERVAVFFRVAYLFGMVAGVHEPEQVAQAAAEIVVFAASLLFAWVVLPFALGLRDTRRFRTVRYVSVYAAYISNRVLVSVSTRVLCMPWSRERNRRYEALYGHVVFGFAYAFICACSMHKDRHVCMGGSKFMAALLYGMEFFTLLLVCFAASLEVRNGILRASAHVQTMACTSSGAW